MSREVQVIRETDRGLGYSVVSVCDKRKIIRVGVILACLKTGKSVTVVGVPKDRKHLAIEVGYVPEHEKFKKNDTLVVVEPPKETLPAWMSIHPI